MSNSAPSTPHWRIQGTLGRHCICPFRPAHRHCKRASSCLRARMHHALGIQEILCNISGHCDRHADLASLARTCHWFKDPALDVLWEELGDMTPLVYCLPEASDLLGSSVDAHSSIRPLTQIEWDNLRSYTRRIRSIQDFRRGLWHTSFRFLSNLPATESLFPNLRYLYCKYKVESMHLLHLPMPSLTSLDINFKDPRWFQDALESFPKFSPNIRNLTLLVDKSPAAFSKLVSNCICQWQNLQIVLCPLVALDVNALAHLSRMHALTELDFTLGTTLSASNPPITFSNLNELTVTSKSLGYVSLFLSRTRLFASPDFAVFIDGYPSRRELSSFFASVERSSVDRTIKALSLCQLPSQDRLLRSEALPLCLKDLQPFTMFSHLLRLELDIGWNVSLTDSDLLALAPAWPKLERLLINDGWGWNSRGGITLDGIVQLLRTCRSLTRISLAIDTRGYTQPPPREVFANLESIFPSAFTLFVVDSSIGAESVPAVAAFFAGIARCSRFYLLAWYGEKMVKPPGWEVYRNRWDEVYRLATGRDAGH